MNNVSFTGRLTADIEPRVTKDGKSVCFFSLAVRRPMTKDVTDFVDFVAWEHSADFAQKYFRKGDMMAVTGYIEQRQKDGKPQSGYYRVHASQIEFCGAKTEAPKEATAPKFEDVSPDEDLPF